MRRAFLLFWALWCVAGSVHAESAVMMESDAAERIADDVRAHVLAAVANTLRANGIAVITAEQAKKAGAACGEQECIASTLERLKADFGVKVTLMTTPGAQTDVLGSVGVAFHQRVLVYKSEAIRVLDSGLERAVDEAVRATRIMMRRGPGPWVVAEGTPPDVQLYLDDQRFDDGDLPCEKRVAPERTHVVLATRAGYLPKRFRFLAGTDPAATYKVQINLEAENGAVFAANGTPSADKRAPDAPVSSRNTHKLATWKDWTLGGALVVVGALVAVNPLRTWAQKGDCYHGCTQTVEFGGRSGALLGVGLGFAITGAIVPTWWKPFGTVEVTADAHSASLRFGGSLERSR